MSNDFNLLTSEKKTEFYRKSEVCNCIEELIELGKENEIELSFETAGELLKQASQEASLSDEDLDAVAGGEDEEMVQCPRCGSWFGNMSMCCPTCKYAG